MRSWTHYLGLPNFEMKYIKGNQKVVADCLSRIKLSELYRIENVHVVNVVTRGMKKKDQENKTKGLGVEKPDAVELLKAQIVRSARSKDTRRYRWK